MHPSKWGRLSLLPQGGGFAAAPAAGGRCAAVLAGRHHDGHQVEESTARGVDQQLVELG
jgi:hypothetical protein